MITWASRFAGAVSLALLAPGVEAADELKLALTCADGTKLVADFGARPGMLLLTIGEQRMLLASRASESGVRYANDDTEFWTKGNEARLVRDGEATRCRLDPAQDS